MSGDTIVEPETGTQATMPTANPTAGSTAADVRAEVRAGTLTGHTAGRAPGFVQANLVILPSLWAEDFLRFCIANPKPCPLLAISNTGDPSLPGAGVGIDIRRDVPRYCVFRDGRKVEETDDITGLWCDDLVSFLIGCSF